MAQRQVSRAIVPREATWTIITLDTERIYKGDSLAVRRSTRSKTSASKPYDRHGGPLSAATASPKDAASRSSASANVRRSLRISPEELVQREAALLAREQEFEAQREALNRATDSLRKQEKENATMMSRLADREGQSVVAQLDGMLCPLSALASLHPLAPANPRATGVMKSFRRPIPLMCRTVVTRSVDFVF